MKKKKAQKNDCRVEVVKLATAITGLMTALVGLIALIVTHLQ